MSQILLAVAKAGLQREDFPKGKRIVVRKSTKRWPRLSGNQHRKAVQFVQKEVA